MHPTRKTQKKVKNHTLVFFTCDMLLERPFTTPNLRLPRHSEAIEMLAAASPAFHNRIYISVLCAKLKEAKGIATLSTFCMPWHTRFVVGMICFGILAVSVLFLLPLYYYRSIDSLLFRFLLLALLP